MSSISVVAGIIWSADKRHILIAKRPQHLHKGGFWEFPGGKLEAGEAQDQALARELNEELSLTYRAAEFFKSLSYRYPEKTVSLSFYHVFDLLTEPEANEGQEWRWVNAAHLDDYNFPEANAPIVKALLHELTLKA